MYATCLHCLAPLGRNEALAEFPVGRRVAFDPARGRLWAVCGRCGRWNLAPLEQRWAAVEECERRYRATRCRFATDHVGLAGLPDGTELVRVGAALRAELAPWRYGAWLLRRAAPRPRAWRALPSLAALGERVATVTTAVVARWRRDRALDVVRLDDAADGPDVPLAVVREPLLAGAAPARAEAGEPWALELAHERGPVRLSGGAGLRAASALLAAANRGSVSPELVAEAARKVDEAADPDGYFRRVLRTAWRWRWGLLAQGHEPAPLATLPARADAAADHDLAVQLTGRSFWAHGGLGSATRTPLLAMPAVDRLALEMVAHEQAERAALETELAALQTAWREAEEIAAIADAL
ncbi:hypothetical protein [Roseisolibacter sp. H3M3-2]|uniref:hypothetical protein n=1 Tax=Roseisolibacter sp. H3M3-2 TaxID=3031323 RepID=UPI0023DC4D11|nr:hypothetical protein [Roseisolibacter sp. H3M3-2]MDF1503050.1 hypothetical protein [Roseisolibacter sp. H3M3-2]